MHSAGADEAPFAKAIADYLGTEHHEIYCTQQDALSIIPQLPYFFDEPFADSSAIPTIMVSKMARQHVKVALSADAGDETFAGYTRYTHILRMTQLLKFLPRFATSAIGRTMSTFDVDALFYFRDSIKLRSNFERVRDIFLDGGANVNVTLSKFFSDSDVEVLLNNESRLLLTRFDSLELKAPYFTELSRLLAIDYQTYLVDDILQKVDRATMSVSLEGREPLLDHRLIEWAAQLPDEYKYHRGIKKFILRSINEKYIPSELMDRPKLGFSVPIDRWMRNELKDFVLSHFSWDFLEQQGLFDVQEVQLLLDKFFSGKTEKGARIWCLLNFQMWYMEWM